MSEKDCTVFNFYFLGTQCVESGVSCTDCYWILLLLIEIPAVPVSTKFSRWRPPNNRKPKKIFEKGAIFFGHPVHEKNSRIHSDRLQNK
jgi:hypothetical protein